MKKIVLLLIPVILIACTLQEDVPTPTATTFPTLPANTHTPPPAATATSAPTLTPTDIPFTLPVFTPFPPADQAALVLDGQFEDWEAFTPIYVDPSGDAGASGVDFTEIYIAHTDTHLLMKVSLGKTVNLQSETALHLSVQIGEDIVSYNFGTRIGRINGASAKQDDIGLISLPTVTSDTFEISFPYTGDPDTGVSILFSDPNEGGDLASPDGEAIVYSWENFIAQAPGRSLDKPENTLRIISWNVLQDNIFDKNLEDHFKHVLQALQPDVILIQEIYIYSEKTALDRVNNWLGGDWYAKQQGDLITISRFPFIEDWKDGNYNLRSRIFPTLIDVNGTPLLVFNAHLSCCDRDQDRQDEVDSLVGFLRDVGLPAGTPFLLAGDLNLVGDAQQLITLLTGDIIDEDKFGADFELDWDGTSLADLVPGHTHTNFSFTWRDDDTSFAPGRLDFFIYSDSVINAQGFVFNTAELPQDVLDAYGLVAEDTSGSDHLPVVADIVLVGWP